MVRAEQLGQNLFEIASKIMIQKLIKTMTLGLLFRIENSFLLLIKSGILRKKRNSLRYQIVIMVKHLDLYLLATLTCTKKHIKA